MLGAKHVPHKRDPQTVLLNSSPGLQNPHKHIWRTHACCTKKKKHVDLPRSAWKTWAHKADVQWNTEMQTIDLNSNRAFDYIPTKSKPQASGIGNEQEWEFFPHICMSGQSDRADYKMSRKNSDGRFMIHTWPPRMCEDACICFWSQQTRLEQSGVTRQDFSEQLYKLTTVKNRAIHLNLQDGFLSISHNLCFLYIFKKYIYKIQRACSSLHSCLLLWTFVSESKQLLLLWFWPHKMFALS